MTRIHLTPKPMSHKSKNPIKTVTICNRVLSVSSVLDTLFSFIAERHAIHQRRIAGEAFPWTDDPVLLKYSFTNVFRVLDRMTQYVLQNVINEGSQTLEESVFRVILFRFFSRTSTYELLQERLGPLTWRDFDIDVYTGVLREAFEDGVSLYGHAYLMPAPKLGGGNNYVNHLRLLRLMMEEELPKKLEQSNCLRDAYGRISIFPSMGNFLGFQLLLDINMIPELSLPENYALCGPGAQACLIKIFGPSVRGIEGPALEYLHQTQNMHFTRLGIPPARRPRVTPNTPPGMSVVDLEHSLCECEKYSRVMHPEIRGKRTTIHRNWEPKREPLTNELPRRWINPAPRKKIRGPPPPVDPTESDPSYHVSHIVMEEQGSKEDGTLYLIRWLGYGPEEDQWLTEEQLGNAKEVLHEWRAAKASIADKVSALQAEMIPMKH